MISYELRKDVERVENIIAESSEFASPDDYLDNVDMRESLYLNKSSHLEAVQVILMANCNLYKSLLENICDTPNSEWSKEDKVYYFNLKTRQFNKAQNLLMESLYL